MAAQGCNAGGPWKPLLQATRLMEVPPAGAPSQAGLPAKPDAEWKRQGMPWSRAPPCPPWRCQGPSLRTLPHSSHITGRTSVDRVARPPPGRRRPSPGERTGGRDSESELGALPGRSAPGGPGSSPPPGFRGARGRHAEAPTSPGLGPHGTAWTVTPASRAFCSPPSFLTTSYQQVLFCGPTSRPLRNRVYRVSVF